MKSLIKQNGKCRANVCIFNNENAMFPSIDVAAKSVASTSNSAYPNFCSGLTNIAKHWFLIFTFSKSRAAVTARTNSNATLVSKPCL